MFELLRSTSPGFVDPKEERGELVHAGEVPGGFASVGECLKYLIDHRLIGVVSARIVDSCSVCSSDRPRSIFITRSACAADLYGGPAGKDANVLGFSADKGCYERRTHPVWVGEQAMRSEVDGWACFAWHHRRRDCGWRVS